MATSKTVKIIPLGGLGEIGKNMTVIEYGKDMLLIDCGLMFPEDGMLGIDYVIPDMSYVIENAARLRAVILTHGHEDHIGGVPYLLQQIRPLVYGTELTLALVRHKLKEHGIRDKMLRTIAAGDTISIGCFQLEFIKMSHSIAGAVAIAIKTPMGVILHTGDFKVDFTPVDGEPMDLNKIGILGQQGLLALLSDSTNVERPGYTMSEQRVGATFDRLFSEAKGRVIVASFASNIHRTQQIINAGRKYGRKICFLGRSMVNVVNISKELGILKLKPEEIIEADKINRFRDNQILVLTTGSQGETMSGLSRMASSSDSKIEIGKGDLVVISASPIPGNEKSVYRVINNLYRLGARVIYQSIEEVHVSGHACQEELKLMLNLAKPKYFIPVHGEYRHLMKHGLLAENLGIKRKNIFELSIGNVLEIKHNSAAVTGSVTSGSVMIDGSGIGDVGNVVLRDRKMLSEEGLMVVTVTIDQKTGKLAAGPEIISRGFVYVRESEEMIEEVKDIVRDIVANTTGNTGDWQTIKGAMRSKLRNYLYHKTGRNPMILPVVLLLEENAR
ncbi:ribonuclease J [Clostridia bacterium OttesenSCG-928-F22]|nr:ribonuclease J [Clostridia bacterium OttesenSCG-928-F22]